MKKYTVYKHTSPNNKVYIGITSLKPEKRWKNGYKHNMYFTNAIKKYGWDNFKHEILYTGLNKDEAIQMEISLIKEYKSNIHNYGYNLTAGGEGLFGKKLTEETKIKIGNANRGKIHTEEQNKQTSIKQKEKYLTDEVYRERLKNINIGRVPSQETIEKYKLRNNKAVIQYSKDGIEIARYNKIKTASEITNIKASSITANCKGKLKSAGGFIWMYVSQDETEELN